MAGRFEHTPEMARKLLASLWERNLPVLRERIDELESAAARMASQRSLSTDTRESACSTAHKLAGSLGMFGYPLGTEAARRLEQHLDGDGPLDSEKLTADVAALKAALPL